MRLSDHLWRENDVWSVGIFRFKGVAGSSDMESVKQEHSIRAELGALLLVHGGIMVI
jgi:hypothetical protein